MPFPGRWLRRGLPLAVPLLLGLALALAGTLLYHGQTLTTTPLTGGVSETILSNDVGLLTRSSQTESKTQPEKPRVLIHQVVAGETLWDIAAQYGTNVETLVDINRLTRSNSLSIGQELKVLTIKGTLRRVQPGDTLSSLAAQYNVSQDEIIKANDLDRPDSLLIGQELIIPGGSSSFSREIRVASASRGTNPRTASRGEAAISITGLIWPVSGRVTSEFGPRWGRMHEGIDIGGITGTTIVAAKSGVVTFAGWMGGYGRTLILDHGDGIQTLYGHNSALLVAVGERVQRGQAVARLGNTGVSTGPHLHFEVRVNGEPTNPRRYLP
ncbi:MAG: M23 family metallopeptidase [Firmicutes bacterium]|nr:M23 family metallopeptidase [Bacillota bacterium]MCL5040224.1 M23 family metallopeptidase [Bacillota bacterium]